MRKLLTAATAAFALQAAAPAAMAAESGFTVTPYLSAVGIDGATMRQPGHIANRPAGRLRSSGIVSTCRPRAGAARAIGACGGQASQT